MSNSVSSRREPWPWHMKLGLGSSGHGLMLVAGADGMLVGRKTQTLENVAPTEQSYSSAPVYKERTFAFKPTAGMGERVQSSHTSRRYRYMLNGQCVGGLFGKGPLTHTLSPTTTGSIRDFVEALHGGTLTQFILAGANVLRRSGDTNGTQTASETRAGQTATSAVRFKGAYASAVDALYVAWSDGVLRQYTGAAWGSAALPAGFLPQFVETVGDELWAGGGNEVRKCTGDPLLAASWSGAFLVGDASSSLTAIRQVANRIFFFKDDGGVYTLNGDGSDNDLFPGLRVTRDATNARTVQAGLDSLWFRMGQSFYRLTALGGPELIPSGPELLRDNDTEVQGTVQAFAFWGAIIGYAATYYGGNSYLWSYGDWETPPEGSATAQFVSQWDGALVKWTGKQVTAMRISGIVSPDTRLYVGFSDGTFDWIKLVPNPLASGSGAEFTLAASKIYPPLHHAMFQADWKATHGFSAFGPVLNSTDYVQVGYRLDGSTAAYTALQGNLTAPGQRVDTANATVGHVLDVEISLVNTTTADTPVLEGIAFHESVRPSLKLDFSGTVDARSHVAKLDGSTDRQTAEEILDLMTQAAGAPGAVTMTMPDETVRGLSFFGYQQRLLPPKMRNGLGWHIDFQATEFKTQTVYGTIGRLKGVLIGDLAGVSVGQLRSW
jgi:hypothetical protein